MSVLEGVDRELAEVAKRNRALADGALAESARAMARALDNGENSATSRSMCAKELRDTMTALRDLAPPVPERTRLDELGDRRAKRLARKAGA